MTLDDLAQRMECLNLQEKKKTGPRASGLHIYRVTEPSALDAMVYDPIVCLIVQGAKRITIGEESLTLTQGEYVVVGHDLPVLARITEASAQQPYLALILRLDFELLRSLEDALEDFDLEPEDPRSFSVARADAALVEVLSRHVALLEDPLEAKVLLPLVQRELHFRLLRSENGAMLRALLNRESRASSIALAIQELRERFRDELDVPQLARSVGMSTSSFHRHFKSMTRTTPLQYQKGLRLTEARRLLRSGQTSVSSAAFEVGYESPSQFSREYRRQFGAPPRIDLQTA